jgi:Lar family restriction alleviation protein
MTNDLYASYRVLQPCPFCGSRNLKATEIDVAGWMIECLDCHSTGPIASSEELTVSLWNLRYNVVT